MRKPLKERLQALTTKVRRQRIRPLAQGDPGRAVSYIRASTDDQRLSLEAQRASIEDWATAARVAVVAWDCVDSGVSGSVPADERDGLVRAIATLRRMNCGILVVAKRDRLARDVLQAALIEKYVTDAGGRVISAAGEGDGVSPEAKLIKTMMDAISEFEGSRIRARITEAFAVKRSRGELTGRVPYGFKVIDPLRFNSRGRREPRRLERCDDEQRVITEARRLHGDGHSYGAIAGELDRLGFKTRTGNGWDPTQIYRMVNAEERP